MDTDCICGDNSFILDISCCVADGCGTQDEKDKVLEFANKICGVGNDLPDDIDATCQRSKGGSSEDEGSSDDEGSSEDEGSSGGDGGSAASRLGGAGFVGAIVAAAFAL